MGGRPPLPVAVARSRAPVPAVRRAPTPARARLGAVPRGREVRALHRLRVVGPRQETATRQVAQARRMPSQEVRHPACTRRAASKGLEGLAVGVAVPRGVVRVPRAAAQARAIAGAAQTPPLVGASRARVFQVPLVLTGVAATPDAQGVGLEETVEPLQLAGRPVGVDGHPQTPVVAPVGVAGTGGVEGEARRRRVREPLAFAVACGGRPGDVAMPGRLVTAPLTIADEGARVVEATPFGGAHATSTLPRQQGRRAEVQPRHVGRTPSAAARAWLNVDLGPTTAGQPVRLQPARAFPIARGPSPPFRAARVLPTGLAVPRILRLKAGDSPELVPS